MLRPGLTLAAALRLVEAESTDTVVVHTFPHIFPDGHEAVPEARVVVAGEIDGIALERDDRPQTITSTRPITGLEASLNAEQLTGWLNDADEQARMEGGLGVLLGYDPLHPAKRLRVADLGVTDDCVFEWDRPAGAPPMFSWSEVAAMSANRGSPSAEILLVDGRAVFLHADVDWDNRLS